MLFIISSGKRRKLKLIIFHLPGRVWNLGSPPSSKPLVGSHIKPQLSSTHFCRLIFGGLDFKDLFLMSVAVKHPAGGNLERHRFVDTALFMWDKIQRPVSKPIFNCMV